MNITFAHVVSCLLGIVAGSLSGYSLLTHGVSYTSKPTRFVQIFPLIRVISIGVVSWYLLRYGAVAFILFGGSTLITMWIVIITHNQ